jgi:hypothetical protein
MEDGKIDNRRIRLSRFFATFTRIVHELEQLNIDHTGVFCGIADMIRLIPDRK